MFKCILVAVDINDKVGATRSFEIAQGVAEKGGATLHILNVVPDSGMAMVGSMLGPEHSRRMVDEAKSALESWAASTIPAEMDAHLHVAQGTIYDRIIKAAEELGTDAIVVGAHRPELQDYLIGPNSARVARHAKQSVIVVR